MYKKSMRDALEEARAYTAIHEVKVSKGRQTLDISKDDLGKYFSEIKSYSSQCKFSNCIHINEPQCEILNKLEKGEISKSRYLNYLDMLKESKGYRNENYQ